MFKFALFLFSALLQQESSTRLANPLNTEAGREAGSRIYLLQCASCHGRDGRGGQGTPDLTTGNFRRASSDEGLYQIIAKGIPGTTMAGFSLEAREIWQTLAYVRSLSVPRPSERPTGDRARGEAIFRAHNCAGCHDHTAPDLQQIARRRTPAQLRRSILDPDAEVPSAYWRLRATTRGGRTISGLRLNEDTYTVQFLDESGSLRGIAKSELSRYQIIRASPMPSLRDKLTPEQLEDLLVYLTGGER
ncbi:MAG: c-type cytochrome [Acidobacteria bacterium]|nr:c-type cytochrome [Acidobacteriota bacterium]